MAFDLAPSLLDQKPDYASYRVRIPAGVEGTLWDPERVIKFRGNSLRVLAIPTGALVQISFDEPGDEPISVPVGQEIRIWADRLYQGIYVRVTVALATAGFVDILVANNFEVSESVATHRDMVGMQRRMVILNQLSEGIRVRRVIPLDVLGVVTLNSFNAVPSGIFGSGTTENPDAMFISEIRIANPGLGGWVINLFGPLVHTFNAGIAPWNTGTTEMVITRNEYATSGQVDWKVEGLYGQLNVTRGPVGPAGDSLTLNVLYKPVYNIPRLGLTL